ncbi:hypothetical protein [Kribbella sp. NPDC048928]|uniref:hypothetical protein n=1 Tax=Kribbella sp. NPDC048928 TaxID=3364111 RepID=UPI003723569F
MVKASQTINVRTWSKTVPAYGLRLHDLDLYVLKNHHNLLRVLGYERVDATASWGRNILVWALHMLFLVALVTGVTTVGRRVPARRDFRRIEALPLGASTTITPGDSGEYPGPVG